MNTNRKTHHNIFCNAASKLLSMAESGKVAMHGRSNCEIDQPVSRIFQHAHYLYDLAYPSGYLNICILEYINGLVSSKQ